MSQTSNRWQDIFNHLKAQGISTYIPGGHSGECLSPYVVLKVGAVSPYKDYSTNLHTYELLCYIPQNQQSSLENILDSVELKMKDLEPMIMPLHTRTSPYFDEEVKGWMVSLSYRNYTKQI